MSSTCIIIGEESTNDDPDDVLALEGRYDGSIKINGDINGVGWSDTSDTFARVGNNTSATFDGYMVDAALHGMTESAKDYISDNDPEAPSRLKQNATQMSNSDDSDDGSIIEPKIRE